MNSFFKKIILASVIGAFFLSATTSVFAQSTQTEFPRAVVNQATIQEDQRIQAQNNQTIKTEDLRTVNVSASTTANTTVGAGAVAGFAGCIAGSGLTGLVKNSIASFTAGLLDRSRVPTGNAVQESKETGSMITAGISWDQMGWCIANSLIEEIGRATVVWINSGFQGNPVFVDDPGQFFTDIADVQAMMFLNEVTGGAMCTPIKDWVKINLLQNYNSQIAGYGQQQCTFDNNALTQFMDGETFSWADWLNYTQNSNNNPYAATVYGEIALNERIAGALGLEQQQLQWSAGFLSKVDPQTGKITSPGTVIEAQVNETLFSGKRRLEIADEFDEVVSALVNQLIRVALTEVMEAGQ